MKKLTPLIFLFALPCCDTQPLPPAIPLGTEIIMRDGKAGWVCADRTFSGGYFRYTVKLPIWGGYQDIQAADFEFTVKPKTPEKQN